MEFYAVNLDEVKITPENARLLKKDDKYIIYPSIAPFCKSQGDSTTLVSIILQIKDIIDNFNVERLANEEIRTIFNGIAKEYIDNASSIDDFMNLELKLYTGDRKSIKEIIEEHQNDN